jgi:uncharacterized protein
VLILLPPSEGKAEPAEGPPVDLASLAFGGQLRGCRQDLMTALRLLADAPREEALKTLGLTPRQSDDVDRDAELGSAPAAPASAVYTGVLYDRLGFDRLSAAARDRAASRVLIASALWGMVRPGDRIPWYRLSMKARPVGTTGLAAWWRQPLAVAMEVHDLEGETILDMRSAAYAAAWKPKRAKLVAVRAFTETGGVRKSVSHMAKATRGEVARLVLSAEPMPHDAGGAAAAAEAAGMKVELSDGFLDVIEPG